MKVEFEFIAHFNLEDEAFMIASYRGCVTPGGYAKAAKRVVSDGYNALKFYPFAIRPDGVWDYLRQILDRERADLSYERVKAVHEAVGPRVDILIEVHCNLGTSSAILMGKGLEEFNPFFYCARAKVIKWHKNIKH